MKKRRSKNDANDEPAKENTTAEEKKKLLQEIKELESIVKQCEWNLRTLRFKDVEERAKEILPPSPGVSSQSRMPPSVDVDLQNDMYAFAGFRCVKFQKDEIVFNFTSTNGDQRNNTYAVQIFIENGKGKLGKWVMPMSVDMNELLSKRPIGELKNISPFLKSCKHHIDCYTARKEQFLSLEKHISNTKHYNLQSDMGFKQISMEMYGVYDNENDNYINLAIYLLYYSDRARPHKININITNKGKLSDDVKQRLKVFLKEFKISDLKTALEKILAQDNSTFTWKQINNESLDESPLELNNTSSSDEGNLLTQVKSDLKASLRKHKKKRELQKKWNKRKRQKKISKDIESSEDDIENDHLKTKVSNTENAQQIPVKETKNRASILKQKRINEDESLMDETPLQKRKTKLKQTKLNFQIHETTNSNMDEVSSESKLRNIPEGKQLKSKPITSTPCCSVDIEKLHLPTLELSNITSTDTSQKIEKLNNSKDNNQLENKGKNSEKKSVKTKNKILRNRKTVKSLSLRMSKRGKRLTRSITS